MNRIPRPTTPAFIAALSVISLVAAACGSSAATPTLAPGATPAPTTAATAGSSVSPTSGQPTDVPGNGGTGVDLGDLAGALEGVDSYRMTVMSDGTVDYQATVVRAPVEASSIEMSGVRIVVIEQEAWMDQGTGTLEPVPYEMVAGMTTAFSPIMLFGAYGQMGALGGLTDLGTESRNGVNARHFRIDSSTPIIGQGMQSGESVDIWVADQGYLVSWESISGTGSGNTSIDITNINDPSNKVDRP